MTLLALRSWRTYGGSGLLLAQFIVLTRPLMPSAGSPSLSIALFRILCSVRPAMVCVAIISRPYSPPAYATVLKSAFSDCRESNLVCCTTTGTSETMTLA